MHDGREIRGLIGDRDDAEIIVAGEREGAGQVYYEVGIRTDNPDEIAEFIDKRTDDDWKIQNHAETSDGEGDPYGYDHETEERIPSHIRLKRNLYIC